MLCQVTIFLTLIITTTHCWELKTSHTYATKTLTSNVTIECRYNGTHNNVLKLQETQRIRILKRNTRKTEWKTVAKVMSSFKVKIESALPEAEVSGYVGPSIQDSFLMIVFPIASEATFGEYSCEVDGYDDNDSFRAVTTDGIEIIERGITFDDIMKIIDDLRRSEKDDHAYDLFKLDLLQKSVGYLKNEVNSNKIRISQLTTQLSEVSKTFLGFYEQVLGKQNKISEEMEQVKLNSRVMSWPSGRYSILSSSNGCPYSSTFDWHKTTVSISTKPGVVNRDVLSNPSHLAGSPLRVEPNKSDRYVDVESCSKADDSAGPAWPKGRYCVQSYSLAGPKECPIGFNNGWIEFDTYSLKNTFVDLPHFYQRQNIVMLYYCCRNDGDVTVSILLPSKDPFYLYRFGGACQQVIGMNVTDEWIQFDTNGDNDSYGGDYHPDGTLSPVRIDLCYYTPKM